MSRKYKFRDDSRLYFVTFATGYWIDVFSRKLVLVSEQRAFGLTSVDAALNGGYEYGEFKAGSHWRTCWKIRH